MFKSYTGHKVGQVIDTHLMSPLGQNQVLTMVDDGAGDGTYSSIFKEISRTYSYEYVIL